MSEPAATTPATAATAAPPPAPPAAEPAKTEAAPVPTKGAKVFYKGRHDEPPRPSSGTSREERLRSLRAKPEAAPAAETPPAEPAKTEAPKTETEKPAEKPAEKASDAKAQFAALARAEKRLREERKALDDERAKTKAERDAGEAKLAEARRLQAIVDAGDKYKVLDHLGLDINEWARRKIGQKDAAPAQPNEALSKVEKLEKDLAERDARDAAAKANADYEAVRTHSLAEINQLVQAETEKYALIGAKKAAPAVFELIASSYQRTGRLLSYAEACDAVEAYLEDDATSYLGVEKIRKKIAAPQTGTAPPQVGSSSEARPTKTTTRTHPNKTTAPDRVATGSLSRSERRKLFVAQLSAPPTKR